MWNFTACSHEGCQIRAVAISEDGEYIVSGGDHESGGGKIYFFDKDSSSPLIEYDTDKEIRYVAISEDGDYFVAASNELVYFFDRYESSPLWTRSESVTSISINDGGDLMAIATQNGYLYVFDSTGSKNFEYHFDGTRYGNHLYAVDISADGKYVSAGSQGGLVILVSLDAGEVLGSIRMMDGSISSISISENGDYIIAGAGYSYSTNSTILLLSNNFTFEEGCMDINAINFNPEAVVDDGSCNYIPPSAQFTWSYTRDGEVFNQSALEGFPTNFDASLSSGYNLGYEWDFGDGSTATGPFVSHTYDYKENGFEVTLTVIDQLGNSHSMSYKIIPALKARPDIYISTLTFSDDNPEAGDEIIINATVKLLRMEIEDSFEVTFYLDGISGEWCLEPHPSCIGRQTVHRGTLSVGDEHTVSLNWNATEGTHTIYVVADSTYKIDESDEKNELSRNIIVLEKKDEGGNASFACQGGESKIAEDGCNQCVCSDGNWVCTEIDCAVSDEEGLLPSVSLLTSLISIGLLAIFRRK